MKTLSLIGAWAGIILPLFNIPLILRIVKRKSASDISLVWLFGVWICIALMMPAALASADFVFKSFNIVNLVCFSIVVIVVIRYHPLFHRKKHNNKNASDR